MFFVLIFFVGKQAYWEHGNMTTHNINLLKLYIYMILVTDWSIGWANKGTKYFVYCIYFVYLQIKEVQTTSYFV